MSNGCQGPVIDFHGEVNCFGISCSINEVPIRSSIKVQHIIAKKDKIVIHISDKHSAMVAVSTIPNTLHI